jgi:hypothetical protein
LAVLRRTVQEGQKQMCASKLPPKALKRINTIFNHFRNTHARYEYVCDVDNVKLFRKRK